MSAMRISIAMIGHNTLPIGGFNMHFNYANLLTNRGHDVTIIFPRWALSKTSWKNHLFTPIWGSLIRLKFGTAVPTFKLDPNVSVKFVPDLSNSSLPNSDILLATSWETSELMREAAHEKGRKFQIVYDYEFWAPAPADMRERMAAALNCGFASISTSGVVHEMLQGIGVTPIAKISGGLDFHSFSRKIPSEGRNPMTVGFAVRRQLCKGTADAIAATTILRNQYGDKLQVRAYGSEKLELPDWIDFVRSPSQSELCDFYNSCAIFIMPSHYEGFGLPGAEALACGAALVTTFNGGSDDYAFPEKTALVVPPKQPQGLAQCVARLLEDDTLRIRLAKAGHQEVQRFQWDHAADALDRLLRTAG
jgi:glycosyltransferase involved in cell wall biosynthesis